MLAEKFTKRVEAAKKAREAEFKRLNGLTEAYAAIKDNPLIKKLQADAEVRAKTGANTLTRACVLFKLRFDYFPSKLEELMKPPDGGRSFLTNKDDLADPFGRQYEYDAAGAKNGGRTPDVWSLGPRHLKDAIIGNWPEKK